MSARIPIDREKIAEFCRRRKITELALFGSVLTDEFGPDSDVDVLVSFADDAHWTLFDLVRMQDELKKIFGRAVHLVSRRGMESSRNPVRREAVLNSAETLYVT